MPIEQKPPVVLPPNFRPENSIPRRVRDGDDWWRIAAEYNLDAWTLIEFNFKTRKPAEVNYYLRTRVGCCKPTQDGKNWMFSSTAAPGIIYIPQTEKTAQQLTRIWYGIAIKVGGTLGIAGKDTAEGWLISADYYDNRLWFNLDNWRLGLGLGASVGVALVIVTSMTDPAELAGHALSDHDFQASMGNKWGTVAKWLSGFEKYGKLASLSAKSAKRIISVAEWENTRGAIQSAASALGLKSDSAIPQVAIIDIPGGGIGLELAVYKHAGVFSVHDVSYRHPGELEAKSQ